MQAHECKMAASLVAHNLMKSRAELTKGTDMRRVQGSFGSGTFAAYAPATKEVELCDVPEEED